MPDISSVRSSESLTGAIGALELNITAVPLADGALESMAVSTAQPSLAHVCNISQMPMCVVTDDGALETASGYALSPTLSPYLCQQTIRMTNGCIVDDGAN